MPEPDPSELLGLSSANLERGELLEESDKQLVARVEQVLAWLDSAPELTEQEREQVAQASASWKQHNEQRLDQLARQARTTAEILALLSAVPSEQRGALLRAQAAVLDAQASSARAVVAIIEGIAAIDRRLGAG